jgi:hypothetical protein
MTHPLEYHIAVRPRIPASLALLGTLALPLVLLCSSPAQNNGTASSGFARAVATPSSSSHGAANSTTPSSTKAPPLRSPGGNVPHPQPNLSAGRAYYYPYVYAVPVPYPVNLDDNGAPGDSDPDYQGGPTVFDRRGSGPYSYIPPGSGSGSPTGSNPDQDLEELPPSADSRGNPQPPPDPTTLVFKDGHQLEVENYAIINQTLYDLTPGHPRKIALADLDLPATQKQNDDHGVAFDLPPAAQAN